MTVADLQVQSRDKSPALLFNQASNMFVGRRQIFKGKMSYYAKMRQSHSTKALPPMPVELKKNPKIMKTEQ